MTKVINSIIKTNSQIKAVLLEFLFSKNPEIKSITASLKILSSATVNTNLNKSIFYQNKCCLGETSFKTWFVVSWCERTFRDGDDIDFSFKCDTQHLLLNCLTSSHKNVQRWWKTDIFQLFTSKTFSKHTFIEDHMWPWTTKPVLSRWVYL